MRLPKPPHGGSCQPTLGIAADFFNSFLVDHVFRCARMIHSEWRGVKWCALPLPHMVAKGCELDRVDGCEGLGRPQSQMAAWR